MKFIWVVFLLFLGGCEPSVCREAREAAQAAETAEDFLDAVEILEHHKCGEDT